MGFGLVYRYTPGKADWLAAGFVVEGAKASHIRIVDHAHRDVPTCSLAELAETVRARVRAAGWDSAVVVNDAGVVLGLLHAREVPHEGAPTAGDVMTSGPVTVRPHLAPADVPDAARKQDLFLVTSSEGVLLGLVRHADLGTAEGARAA